MRKHVGTVLEKMDHLFVWIIAYLNLSLDVAFLIFWKKIHNCAAVTAVLQNRTEQWTEFWDVKVWGKGSVFWQ